MLFSMNLFCGINTSYILDSVSSFVPTPSELTYFLSIIISPGKSGLYNLFYILSKYHLILEVSILLLLASDQKLHTCQPKLTGDRKCRHPTGSRRPQRREFPRVSIVARVIEQNESIAGSIGPAEA